VPAGTLRPALAGGWGLFAASTVSTHALQAGGFLRALGNDESVSIAHNPEAGADCAFVRVLG